MHGPPVGFGTGPARWAGAPPSPGLFVKKVYWGVRVKVLGFLGSKRWHCCFSGVQALVSVISLGVLIVFLSFEMQYITHVHCGSK